MILNFLTGVLIPLFALILTKTSYYNHLLEIDRNLQKIKMASSTSTPLPNEYFRFTLPQFVSDAINDARDSVLGPLESRKKLIGTDTHITVYFIGNKRHLTQEQRDLFRCFTPLIRLPVAWKVSGISLGDVSPVVMLDLEFYGDYSKLHYQGIYESIYGYLRFLGFENAMNLATPKQHPKCHITLSWANDKEHAAELITKFQQDPNIQGLIGQRFHAQDFELFHNTPECIESYYPRVVEDDQ